MNVIKILLSFSIIISLQIVSAQQDVVTFNKSNINELKYPKWIHNYNDSEARDFIIYLIHNFDYDVTVTSDYRDIYRILINNKYKLNKIYDYRWRGENSHLRWHLEFDDDHSYKFSDVSNVKLLFEIINNVSPFINTAQLK